MLIVFKHSFTRSGLLVCARLHHFSTSNICSALNYWSLELRQKREILGCSLGRSFIAVARPVVTTFEWAFQFNFISFFSYALHRCAREWDFMQFYCVRYNVEFALIGARWVMQHNFNLKKIAHKRLNERKCKCKENSKLTVCPARAHRCDLLMSSLTSSFASNFHFMRATLAQPQPDSQPIYIYFKFTFLFFNQL